MHYKTIRMWLSGCALTGRCTTVALPAYRRPTGLQGEQPAILQSQACNWNVRKSFPVVGTRCAVLSEVQLS